MLYSMQSVNVPTFKVPVTPENVAAFYAVLDVDSSKAFAKNYGGYPRSDIAMLNEEQNEEVAMYLSQRLFERSGEDTSKFDDAQLLAAHRSRYCQSPSEMVNFIDNNLSKLDAQRLEKLDGEEREKAQREIEERRRKMFDSLSSQERDEVNAAKRKKEVYETLLEM